MTQDDADKVMEVYDVHPSFTRWAIQTRAAKLQQKSALQEQLRGLGIEIAALEKIIQDVGKKGGIMPPVEHHCPPP